MYTEEDFEEFGRFLGYGPGGAHRDSMLGYGSFAEYAGKRWMAGLAGLRTVYDVRHSMEDTPEVLEAAFALWLGLCD